MHRAAAFSECVRELRVCHEKLERSAGILNVEDMQPQTEDNHCAAKPARFALEMNLGWFRQKGVRPGQKIDGVARLADVAR